MSATEKIIINLRNQIKVLDRVSRMIISNKNEIKELIDDLTDESKLGAPPDYDFGSDKLKQLKKNINRDLKESVKSLNNVIGSTEEEQFQSSQAMPAGKDEFEKS